MSFPSLVFSALIAATPPQPTGLAGWAVSFMDKLGAVGAGIAVFLENVFPPIPSEVILPLAGFTAAQGRMSLLAAIGFTTLGSVVGAWFLYAVGALFGRQRLWAVIEWMPLVDVADANKAEAWFNRHGTKAVFFGRMIPVVRSMISIPAGLERMSLLPFTAYTALGSGLWNTIFIVAGYLLGEQWYRVEPYSDILQKIVLALAAVAVVAYIVRRIVIMRRPNADDSVPDGKVGPDAPRAAPDADPNV